MNTKPPFLPVDLVHLQDKAETLVAYFKSANNEDRSPEFRAFHLKKAEDMAETLVQDFAYYMDTYTIGGIVPYGLSQEQPHDQL